jgi:S1-C subfamily serine protease
VVTNNHVVEGGSELVIMDPKDHERQLPATVVATLTDPDIALLRCEQLDAPSLPLAAGMPRNGTDIMALGYPGGSLLGMEQKLTRGTVISQSDPQMDGGNFLHSATVNPGNSGGPVVNDQGHVVGVVVAVVRTATIGNAYSVGIPVERIWPFLSEHLAELQPAEPDAEVKTWPDVGDAASPGTVFISAKIKRVSKKKPANAVPDAAPAVPPQQAQPTPPVTPTPPAAPATPDSPAPTDEN